jgi:hypothetical protein
VCPIKIWAVAWTQGSLEPVCREERKRGRRGLKRGQARLVEIEKINWIPAEMEEA